MRKIPYYVVDVFTGTQMGGNPLAVFPVTGEIREAEMQKIARELNLSETVFVYEPTDDAALRRLRIFTPAAELPLAGHPVIGSWYLLATKNFVDFDAAVAQKKAFVEAGEGSQDKVMFRHQLNVGVLPVMLLRDNSGVAGVVMDQSLPRYGEELRDVSICARALGLDPSRITGSFSLPRAVNIGAGFIMIVPLATRNDLEAISIDTTAFEQLKEQHEAIGLYAFTRDADAVSETALVAARGFFPLLGVPEDPATGSAAGSLGCYMAKQNLLSARETNAFQIEQGVEIGRPSQIGVEVTTKDGEVTRIRVGGTAVITSEATMYLP